MAKRLTKKQREFVNEYVETGNGVQAALKAYDTTDYGTANAIATENLQKPAIIQELNVLGFDANTAKGVVSEILRERGAEPQHRLKAAELVFKVNGDFAPEKHVTLNLDANSSDRTRELGTRLVRLFGRRN